MEITWWGAAGFRVKTGKVVFLIDPYLSRNKIARPKQYLKPEEIIEGELIFISHGHFDHLLDVPLIAKNAQSTVYCSVQSSQTLREKGLDKKQIHEVPLDGYVIDFYGNQAQAFFSQHVVFDRKLILKTLMRMNIRLFQLLPLFKEYPVGQVLSWRFKVEGKIVHYFGSGGSPPEEMEKLASQPTDILLIPLQGHGDICNIALEYVHVMQPKIVIPHHQDDFFPPVSASVDITPFIKSVERECSNTEVKVLELNETIIL